MNTEERMRFIQAANKQSPEIKAFCFTLFFTGCRLSEARELRFSSVQTTDRLISFRSLKKRDKHHIREVPIPSELIACLDQLHGDQDQFVWGKDGQKISRVTAYRWIKNVTNQAEIFGTQACPKGLRHSYGIHAVRSGVQLHMLQKWMGHADISTTAIYANAVGKEELEIADRMWRN